MAYRKEGRKENQGQQSTKQQVKHWTIWISLTSHQWKVIEYVSKGQLYHFNQERANIVQLYTCSFRGDCIIWRIARMEQKQPTNPEHIPFLVLAARSLVFWVMFCRSLFALFCGATVLRFTTLITSLVSFVFLEKIEQAIKSGQHKATCSTGH